MSFSCSAATSDAASGIAVGRGLAERAPEDLVVDRGQVEVPLARRGRVLVDHAVHDGGDAVALEGPLAGEHLVGHAPRSENRSARCGDLGRPTICSGRHVGRRAEEVAGGRGHRGLEPRHPEVHQLGPAVGQHHDVGGLDVAVDDRRSGARSRARPRAGSGGASASSRGSLPRSREHRLQGRALEVLHDEVVLAHVEDARRCSGGTGGPRPGPRGGTGAGTPRAVSRVRYSGLTVLIATSALHQRVEAAVDAAHGAVADLLLDLVAAEPLAAAHLSLMPRAADGDQHVARRPRAGGRRAARPTTRADRRRE